MGGREGTSSFFGQGHAVANEGDRTRSRQDAIRNMQVQTVTQAAGSFITPPQMGSRFNDLQSQILSHPERYVQNYQIYSESPSDGGLYRVNGLVTISMDLLKQDLLSSGFISTQGTGEPKSAADPTIDEADSNDVRPDDVGSKREEEPDVPPDGAPDGKSAVLPADGGNEEQAQGGGGTSLFWVVAEQWGRGFVLPQDQSESGALFMLSFMQESEDFSWNLVFPDDPAVLHPGSGDISADLSLREAERAGGGYLLLGRVTLQRDDSGSGGLQSELRVYDVPSGRLRGEIHKAVNLQGITKEEGALNLAGSVVPQLDAILRKAERTDGEEIAAQRPPRAPREKEEEPVGTDNIEVRLMGQNAYGLWLELEQMLRRQAPEMVVESLEFARGEISVRLAGISRETLGRVNGASTKNGFVIRVSPHRPGSLVIDVSFESPSSESPSSSEPEEPDAEAGMRQ